MCVLDGDRSSQTANDRANEERMRREFSPKYDEHTYKIRRILRVEDKERYYALIETYIQSTKEEEEKRV